jgi:hypothetical protein
MHDVTHFLNRTPYMGVTEVVQKAKDQGIETVVFPGDAGLALMRFSDSPEIEIQKTPPPSVLWPILGTFLVGGAVGGLLTWWLAPAAKGERP